MLFFESDCQCCEYVVQRIWQRVQSRDRRCEIVSIGTQNQWNEFNDDYQIDDLSQTLACRASATNRRHRWTPNRTLMHAVISRRFIVLLQHTSMFGHPRAFLSRISLRDHSSLCVTSVNCPIQKVSGAPSRKNSSLGTIYKVIARE